MTISLEIIDKYKINMISVFHHQQNNNTLYLTLDRVLKIILIINEPNLMLFMNDRNQGNNKKIK